MDKQFAGAGIQAKLMHIQTNLRVPKDNAVKNWNGKTQYLYRNLSTIFEKVKPLLEQTGCTILVWDDPPMVVGADIEPVWDVETDKNGNSSRHMVLGPHVYIRAHARLTDIETGGFVEVTKNARENEWRKGMDASQLSGSVSSYAGKYACEGLFGLDGSEDSDALAAKDAATEAPEQPKAKKPAQKKQLFKPAPKAADPEPAAEIAATEDVDF